MPTNVDGRNRVQNDAVTSIVGGKQPRTQLAANAYTNARRRTHTSAENRRRYRRRHTATAHTARNADELFADILGAPIDFHWVSRIEQPLHGPVIFSWKIGAQYGARWGVSVLYYVSCTMICPLFMHSFQMYPQHAACFGLPTRLVHSPSLAARDII
ncbi:hypothetical protein B0H13DRAFT_2268345 [Mycena leptocephala]|nr:hypothetical protein B0H13DRAFT_2268345 [Mycena leptocephala]